MMILFPLLESLFNYTLICLYFYSKQRTPMYLKLELVYKIYIQIIFKETFYFFPTAG